MYKLYSSTTHKSKNNVLTDIYFCFAQLLDQGFPNFFSNGPLRRNLKGRGLPTKWLPKIILCTFFIRLKINGCILISTA